MRVIAGKAKGKRLKAPSGMDTRPLTDMIKEALFNVIGDKIVEANFLDLFAGSGSAGIEALSRGAARVIFIDSSREASRFIKDNLRNCGFYEFYEVYRNDVFKAIKILDKRGILFNIIYLDPPFKNEKIFDRVIRALDEAELLDDRGILIVRTPRRKEMPEKLSRIEEYRKNNYGESTLHYYRLNKGEGNFDGNSANS